MIMEDKECKEYFKIIDPIDESDISTEGNTLGNNLTEISRTASVVQSVKKLSHENPYVRMVVYAIFCNPFIKLLINVFYKLKLFRQEDFDKHDERNVEDILTSNEKTNLTLFVLGILSIFNILIICFVKDFGLKVFILFVNNMYLLFFTYTKYREENLKKTEGNDYYSLSWDSFRII